MESPVKQDLSRSRRFGGISDLQAASEEEKTPGASYEDYLREKLEGKSGYRDTLNRCLAEQRSSSKNSRQRLLQLQQSSPSGALDESQASLRSSRPPVFMKQVQESLDRIQLETGGRADSAERKSKQQASAVELQHQLNELLAGIVHNFNKGSSLQPTDLFS